MTREEKMVLLVDELENIRCDYFDADTDEDKTLKEAVLAIKALEQQPILDKIKAEIDHVTEIHSDGEFYIKNFDVKRIIDKYKCKESEE